MEANKTAKYRIFVGVADKATPCDGITLAGVDIIRYERSATCSTYACAIDAVLNEIDAADRLFGEYAAVCITVDEVGGKGFLTLPWMRPEVAGEVVYAEAVTL